MLARLDEAAARGVRVRVLLDGIGSSTWTYAEVAAELKRAAFRFFHPLPWQRENGWISTPYHRWLVGLWKLNRRNHRKVCIIDGARAFVGGMNLSSLHSRAISGESAWRDTTVEVSGLEVSALTQAFATAWNCYDRLVQRSDKEVEPSALVRLSLSQSQRQALLQDLVARIHAAKQRIWITNAYFVPTLRLARALSRAAASGTDVRLILPRKSDVWGIRWAIHSLYFYLLSAGVKVHEYRPAVLHAKVLLIDDFVIVGSSNLNHRSLLRDLEVDVVLTKAESVREIEARFEQDLGVSEEITLKAWTKRPWQERLLEFLARAVRRWV